MAGFETLSSFAIASTYYSCIAYQSQRSYCFFVSFCLSRLGATSRSSVGDVLLETTYHAQCLTLARHPSLPPATHPPAWTDISVYQFPRACSERTTKIKVVKGRARGNRPTVNVHPPCTQKSVARVTPPLSSSFSSSTSFPRSRRCMEEPKNRPITQPNTQAPSKSIAGF